MKRNPAARRPLEKTRRHARRPHGVRRSAGRREGKRGPIEESGVILLVVLWVVAIATVAMYGAMGWAGSQHILSVYRVEEAKLNQIAMSGIEFGIGELLADPRPYVAPDAPWLRNPGYRDVACGDGSFSLIRPAGEGEARVGYGIEDETARINLNTTPWAQLRGLGMPDSVAQQIEDWRDENNDRLPEGAESSEYSPLGYRPKNKPFETIGELLLVRDMTTDVLYGMDRNRSGFVEDGERASYSGTARHETGIHWGITWSSWDRNQTNDGKDRLNLNKASVVELQNRLGDVLNPQQIQAIYAFRQQGGSFTSGADLLNIPTVTRDQVKAVFDRVTVTDEKILKGPINVNTAERRVLAALGLDANTIEAILSRRAGGGEALATPAWVLDADEPFFRVAANFLTTRSRTFRIDVIARLQERPLHKRYVAIVEIDGTPKKVKILHLEDLSGLPVNAWEH